MNVANSAALLALSLTPLSVAAQEASQQSLVTASVGFGTHFLELSDLLT